MPYYSINALMKSTLYIKASSPEEALEVLKSTQEMYVGGQQFSSNGFELNWKWDDVKKEKAWFVDMSEDIEIQSFNPEELVVSDEHDDEEHDED